MCDEAKLKVWARDAISRRQFGVLAGAATIAACAPDAASGDGEIAPSMSMFSDAVSIITEDGTMDGFLLYPEEGEQYPAIIHWPDIGGVRQSHIEIAMRLASEGYAVLVVNPYYRDVAGEQFKDFAAFIEADGFQKVKPWRDKLSSFAVKRDATAIVEWLDGQEQVDSARGIGTTGYCMGGPFTVYTAHAVPDRVKAAASFHGGGLVRDDDESPHKLLEETDATYLIAIAQDDHAQSPRDKLLFAKAAGRAGRPAKIDVYEGDHGWTVPDSPAFADAAAERAYADMITLFEGAL